MATDFHDRRLASTVGPLIIMALLFVTFKLANRRNKGRNKDSIDKVKQRCMSMILLVSFLIYSSASSTIFQFCLRRTRRRE